MPVQPRAKKELALKCYKLHKAHHLTGKKKRKWRRQHMVVRVAGRGWERTLFTNEMFTVQNLQAIMVWEGICPTEKVPGFCGRKVKNCSRCVLTGHLEIVVFTWAQQHVGNAQWTFQQDSAPGT